jgi:Tetratricopeptide repeat
VTAFLVSSFRKPGPAQDGSKVTVAEVLGRTVRELEGRAKMAPAIRAAILNAVGETYYGLGLVPETVIALEKTLALRRQELGDDHPETLGSMSGTCDIAGNAPLAPRRWRVNQPADGWTVYRSIAPDSFDKIAPFTG